MANSITDNYATSKTMWQENEEGLSESALVFNRCNGGVSIQQEDKWIYVADAAINDFCKTLKEIAKEKP